MRWLHVLLASVILIGLAACEQESTPQVASDLQTLEFKVGAHQGQVPFGDVTCELTSGRERYQLMSTEELKGKHGTKVPAVLIVTVAPQTTAWSKGQEGEASAFIPEIELGGAEYHPLMIVAQDVENGSQDFECSLQRDGKNRRIECSNGSVRPWRSAGEVPSGAFRAAFTCP